MPRSAPGRRKIRERERGGRKGGRKTAQSRCRWKLPGNAQDAAGRARCGRSSETAAERWPPLRRTREREKGERGGVGPAMTTMPCGAGVSLFDEEGEDGAEKGPADAGHAKGDERGDLYAP